MTESDLPNSILNEEAEETTEADKDEIVIDYPPEGFDVQDDYQLQRAIELIKSGSYTQRLAELQN